MREEIIQKLVELNRTFYSRFSQPFAETRNQPQPGYSLLIKHLPKKPVRLLDVGCGEGRFGRHLQKFSSNVDYVGIDFSPELLAIAMEKVDGTFFQREIGNPDCLEGLGEFDIIVCLATLQHIPGKARRIHLLQEFRQHLAGGGEIWLSTWQFLGNERQMKKITDWSRVGISTTEVEQNDYLLSWQRGGIGYRYVNYIGDDEIKSLTAESGLKIKELFRADGKEGNLNLYSLLTNKTD